MTTHAAVSATAEPPLDETVFSSPSLLASWGELNTDNILFYFASSPFFDRTSNNATIFNQAHFNPAAMGHLVATRSAFESHLRSMTGLEFVVAHDPTRNGQIPASTVTGCWTIRKQIRRNPGNGPASTEVLAEYFVVGDRIFQAPALGAVLATRLLSTAKALVRLVGRAGECVEFEAARGHVYPSSSVSAVVGKAAVGSRESTPVVGALDADDSDEDEMRDDEVLFAETLANCARWGNEYMDEHPLVGEPGNFVIHKANEMQASGVERKGIALPALTIKTDIASAVNKRDKSGVEKSPLSPTGTGATKKRKKDRVKTPKEPKTPAA